MKYAIALVVVCGVLLVGCSEAGSASRKAWGNDATITLYNGGQTVRTWTSEGRVMPEMDSDGWYFKDKETGTLVRVSGTVVIEYSE